jgi:hypothetical protein
MTDWIAVAVPMLSVLVGATITYLLNVRARTRNRVEDYFDDAVAAVSVVVSTMSYVPGYGKWHEHVTEKERVDFEKEMAREATLNHMRALAAARDAVARCVPYRPSLSLFIREPVLYFQDHADEIIEELRTGAVSRRRTR